MVMRSHKRLAVCVWWLWWWCALRVYVGFHCGTYSRCSLINVLKNSILSLITALTLQSYC